MLAFLVADDGIIYMLGGHEAMGKERAFGVPATGKDVLTGLVLGGGRCG